jgi:hypothetical protein
MQRVARSVCWGVLAAALIMRCLVLMGLLPLKEVELDVWHGLYDRGIQQTA